MGLIRAFEGKGGQPEPVRTTDPAGNWEVGWSHKLTGPNDPLWNVRLEPDQADALCQSDLTAVSNIIQTELQPDALAALSEGQFAALIDFGYNEGTPRLLGSTLFACVKTGALVAAYSEFPKWIYTHINGLPVVEDGLVRRRRAEQAVWQQNPAIA